MPGQPSQVVSGAIDRVPCPHCGKPNNFKEVDEQQLLDTGSTFVCDYCQHPMEVTAVRTVKMVAVRKSNAKVQQRLPAARQATTMSPEQAQRLLRGR